ncbi:hypothetical protein GOP47_0004958 [Adiantum capillus-veneris]|uniref:RING-CH-type domain-containing protein n=1 Tax=Adiantum capillus-veneris TaxID=13818 RepID=A0A9D4ZL52_ADICA|nr:hypothetical protein GOP47_0004958 [Adiantum capillus-veneris]
MGLRGEEAEHALKQEQVCVHIEDRTKVASNVAQLYHGRPFESSVTLAIPTAISTSALSFQPECRICQEEEDPSRLEIPCDCSGTLKYAHRECVQRWCNEKGDTICEICLQPYKQGYSVSRLQYRAESFALDLSDTWDMELRDPRILALAAAQRRLLDADYEEYSTIDTRSAACCRFVVLIFMALLLLRHTTAMAAATDDEDAFLFLLIFLLRMVGLLLPCFIMVRAMSMLQRGQPEQATAVTSAEVGFWRRGRHPRGIRVALLRAVELP